MKKLDVTGYCTDAFNWEMVFIQIDKFAMQNFNFKSLYTKKSISI